MTRSGCENPNWKGGNPNFGKRKLVYAPGHPGAKLCKGIYILEYRLLAEQKIGRPLFDNEIVHHVNGDVADNRLENLEVMTQSEHARQHGLKRKGVNHPMAKINEQQVREIRTSNEDNGVLAKKYGLTRNYVASIKRFASWSHLK